MVLGWLVGLLVAAPPVVLSDCETTAGWPADAKLIGDAKVGAHAVRLGVPPGVASGPSFSFKGSGIEPARSQALTFWYRLSGTGETGLMIKVVAPVTEGWQGTWDVVPRRAADGQWHKVRIDLGSGFMRWGDRPDLEGRWIGFRTEAEAGAKLTLDVDQLQLEPIAFHARLLSARLVGETLEARLALDNPTAAAITLSLPGGPLTLAAGAQAEATAKLPVTAAELAASKPLTPLTKSLRVQVAGQPETAVEIEAPYAVPLRLPDHPRLLISADEVPQIKARAAANPALQARLDSFLKDADNRLVAPINLPPRGGQWYHWYACKKDGGNLRQLSPTQHECPVCKTVYTGWPYDDVVLSNIHGDLSNRIKILGLAYGLTGDAKYADRCREALLAYAGKYESYPLHDINGKPNVGGGRVGPQTLDESTWLIPVCQGADLVWNRLSEADRETLASKLFRPAAEVIRQHKMGIHNIQCWKNSAVGLVGLLLGDAELTADAVRGTSGFENQMAKGVNLDGQWYEGAWGYHFYTMSAVAPLVEAGERCGLGLYAFARDGRSYRLLFDGPLNLAMPNRVLPNFSDSGFVNVVGQSALYELALRRYGDPRYAGLIAQTKGDSLEALLVGTRPLPAAQAADDGSRNYTQAGYAILQSGGGVDATWACLKYGPHGGGHGHPDKMNVILYARQKVLGVDPGTGKYGVPLHSGWQQASLAHNSLTVDEVNQTPTTGSCLAFVKEAGWSGVLADAGPVYTNLTYRRAAALVGPNLLLMLDMVKADKNRTFDLAWHNGGTWAAAPAGEALTMPDKPGYRYLEGMVKLAGAAPPVVLDPLRVGLAVASAQPGETWAGTGPGDTQAVRVPCLVRRVKGAEAQVAWAIALDGQTPTVAVAPMAGGWQVSATVGGKTVRLDVTPEAAVKLRVATQ